MLVDASDDAVIVVRAAIGADIPIMNRPAARRFAATGVHVLILTSTRETRTLMELLDDGHQVVVLRPTRDDADEQQLIGLGAMGLVALDAPLTVIRLSILAATRGETVFTRLGLGRWLRASRRARAITRAAS